MQILNRRNFIKTAAAASALPLVGRAAFADEPLKVGYIYLGPVGDFGWTWAHEKGRKAMVDHFKGKVVADYVENVNEDASATPVIKDLAAQGHKLIFTTSFGYMDQTLEVAKAYPDAKFEHCTGYKHADNVATYNNRFHEGRAVLGTIAGMMSKSGTIGYLGSFKVPEVVMGVNSFALAAQAVNPNIKVKLVMIDSWFDPAKEARFAPYMTGEWRSADASLRQSAKGMATALRALDQDHSYAASQRLAAAVSDVTTICVSCHARNRLR